MTWRRWRRSRGRPGRDFDDRRCAAATKPPPGARRRRLPSARLLPRRPRCVRPGGRRRHGTITSAGKPGIEQTARRLAAYRRRRHGHRSLRQGRARPGHSHRAGADRRRRARRLDGRLRMVAADTDLSPDESYTSGSMSIQQSGAALRQAAAEARLIRSGSRRRGSPSRSPTSTSTTAASPRTAVATPEPSPRPTGSW